jgi:hypothetical protein
MDMNYNYHYSLLVSRARNRILEGVVERHHVIPKCLGGIDDLSNIVALTPEEHFLAHQLLCKMHPNEPKLVFAMHMMTANKYGHRNNNKMYGWIRKKCVAGKRSRVRIVGNDETLLRMFRRSAVDLRVTNSLLKVEQKLPKQIVDELGGSNLMHSNN